MARKGWSTLSAAYRKRLEGAGISKSDYESGASIQKARGHSKTPERPSAANPQKHVTYINERDKLINQVVAKKHYYFSTKPMFNPIRASRPFKEMPPTLKELRKWANMTRQEWLDAIHSADSTTIGYFGYH